MLSRIAVRIMAVTSLAAVAASEPFQPSATVTAHDLRNASATRVLQARITAAASKTTCGYQNGDPSRVRTAEDGFDCRVDTQHGLWGFCTTTVIAATDCNLAGACFDQQKSCSKGCGSLNAGGINTITCSGSNNACSFAVLTVGVDQTYTYIGCNTSPVVDHYLATPSSALVSTTSTTTTSSTSTSTSSSPSSSSSGPTTLAQTTAASAAGDTGPPSSKASDTGSIGDSTRNAIIGGVIGGLALVCGSVVAAIYLWRKDRAKRQDTAAPTSVVTDLSQDYMSSGHKSYQPASWPPSELATQHQYSGNLVEMPGEGYGHRY